MKNLTKNLLVRSGLFVSMLTIVGSNAHAVTKNISDKVESQNVLDQEKAKAFKIALKEYMDSIKIVADQLTEDAEVVANLTDKVKARTVSVKVYTCWANAYNDYGVVLNSYYQKFLTSFSSIKGQTPESFLLKAIQNGKIIQNFEDLDMPFEFKSYIEVRRQNLMDIVGE